MDSIQGKPLTSEAKKIVVSVKQYFDRNKFQPSEPSTKRTAEALGIGQATVKRVLADYSRDPRLLDEPARTRGRPAHSLSTSHQEAVRTFIRSANKNGEHITLTTIRDFLAGESEEESFHITTLARTLNRWGLSSAKGLVLNT